MNSVLNFNARAIGFATIGVCINSAVVAQNVTMFGGNSTAQECYNLSQIATVKNSASRTDLEVCDKAIFHGALDRDSLIATYVNRGIIYTAMQDYKHAARDYNKALSMSDNVGEAYVNRGNLWFIAGRFKDAISDYDKSLEYGIEKPHIALLNRGMAYELTGELAQALSNYEAALEKIEGWPMAQKKLERVKAKMAEAAANQPDDGGL